MKKIFKIIGYLFIGLSVIMVGSFGAYTIDGIYDSFKVIREHQEQIDEIEADLSDSKQAVYNLMGGVTVLKHNQVNNQKKLTSDLIIKNENLYMKLKKLNNSIFILRNKIKKLEEIKVVVQPKPTYEEMKSSTVYIVQQKKDSHEGSVGTGVIVKQEYIDTYILTNKHVCNEDNKGECFVEIYKHGNFLKIPLTFVKQEKSDYDLAIWKTSEFLPNKTEIKGLKEAFPQDKVYSVGNYLGFRYIYTEGTFAGYQGKYIMLNMPCVYGCSGSAVFNKDGYLIGLVFAGNRIDYFQVDASKVLLVPYEIIKRFLEDI